MNPTPALSTPRILITEDDAFTANLCRDVFTRENFEVHIAADGKLAIEHLLNHPVDFVLLDLMLPEIDGIGVLRFIRSQDRLRGLPVIVLSNLSYFSGMAQSAWDAGATNFLKKGAVNPRLLVEEVRNLIAKNNSPVSPPVFAEPNPSVAEEPSAPAQEHRQLRVLVADDDRLVHSVIKFFMTQAGYQVDCAYDGRQALEMAQAKRPDVMILDGIMPELDGIEVVDRWLRDTRLARIPIVMLTSDDASHRKVASLRNGRITILSKPFSPDRLVSKVGEVCRGL
ncbi:MAG: response regulator [Verrucomicrobiota bacterium]